MNQEEALKNEESIGESGRIFLRNLAYTSTEEDIEKLFSKYGRYLIYMSCFVNLKLVIY